MTIKKREDTGIERGSTRS